MSKNNDYILTLLSKHKALLSSDLITLLVSNYNLSSTAARQAIFRAFKSGKILRYGNFRYSSNVYIYIPFDVHKKEVKSAIIKIWQTIDKPIYRLLSILNSQKFLFEEEYLKILGVPINSKGETRRTATQIIDSLLDVDIIDDHYYEDNYGDNHHVISLRKNWLGANYKDVEEIDLLRRYNQLNLTNLVLKDSISFFSYIGFIGWNSEKIFSIKDHDLFSNYYFDAYSASFIRGNFHYNDDNEKKGTTVLFSSTIYRQYTMYDFQAFKAALQNVESKYRKKTNVPKIIPIIICKSMQSDAFREAKVSGYIIVTLGTIFGKKISDNIDNILSTKSADIMKADPKVLESLASKDGAMNNLRGALFQYMIARILTSIVPNADLQIETKHKDPSDKQKCCECDIIIALTNSDNDKDLFVFELKCFSDTKNVSLGKDQNEADSVKKFFEKTRTILKSEIGNRKQKVIPIFISSTNFQEDAIQYMDNQKNLKKILTMYPSIRDLTEGNLYINRKRLIEIITSYNNLKDIDKTMKMLLD